MNAHIVFAGPVGFSQRGRHAAEPAFDDLIQSASGLPQVQAAGTDGVPRYLPITIADRSVGLCASGSSAQRCMRVSYPRITSPNRQP